MSSKIKREGPGIKELINRVKNPGTVQVGIIDAGMHDDSEETVASIGFEHEFGVGVPERSFLRSTLHGSRKDILSLNKKLLKNIVNLKIKVPKALGILGSFVADKVSQKIVAIKSPPNSPATILAKGSSNPLVDSGQLKNSITWEVQ